MEHLILINFRACRFLLFTIIFVLIIPYQSSSQISDQTSMSSHFNEYKEEIVARIGDFDLSAQEFLFNYEFGPAFLKRTPNSKKKYLTIMIYEKLLAMDGYRNGIHLQKSVDRSLKAYEEDIITEELFKDDVMSQVEVTSEEIERTIPLEQKDISIRWIYSSNESDIIRYWHALNRGEPFDSLFYEQLNDSVSIDERSMESTFFRLQLKNPALASIVDTLSVNVYTNPIKTPDGWYILRIDNIWTNVISSESEIEKLKHELERAIFKKKLDRASDEYVKKIMNQHNPEIDKKTFRLVVDYINENALYPESYNPSQLDRYLHITTDKEVASNEQDTGKKTLVYGKSVHIYFNDFIDWYRPRMAYLKFSSESIQNFILSVNETVWRMVRDFLLVKKAKELNLDKRESVLTQIKWWRDKIVFNAVKAEIATSIKFDENDLKNYYKKNIKDYRYQDGLTIPFEKAKGNVQSDYIKEKYTSQLMHRILKLKQEYEISIDEGVLNQVNVTDEENPKTIDLYAVKKGGLLPRQPYPTIDWEWQTWY